MSEMIEQVALAIGKAEGYVSKPVMRKRWKKAARAAIAAMRNAPLSDAMLDAASEANENDGPISTFAVWRALLDAALGDQP